LKERRKRAFLYSGEEGGIPSTINAGKKRGGVPVVEGSPSSRTSRVGPKNSLFPSQK